MAYTNAISLHMANKIFSVIGVSFEENVLEGGYIAKYCDRVLRRRTLTECCTSVLTEWLVIRAVNESKLA